jgi:hypothetical protein
MMASRIRTTPMVMLILSGFKPTLRSHAHGLRLTALAYHLEKFCRGCLFDRGAIENCIPDTVSATSQTCPNAQLLCGRVLRKCFPLARQCTP